MTPRTQGDPRRFVWHPDDVTFLDAPSNDTLIRETISEETWWSWLRLVEAFESSGDLHRRFPREYSSWRHAKARVNNRNDKKFASHGKRGIGMSASWQNSFAQFLKDMGRRPKGTTLERNRNNGDYTKSNCRWATVAEQNANRRGWAKKSG